MCSVPGCLVSRNTLGKWRQAAVEQFLFPVSLPLTLHTCPDAERERWMAEIDLDPSSKAKVVVCSLHFRNGFPSSDFPFPTQLLSECSPAESPVYTGVRPSRDQSLDLGDWANLEAKKCSRLVIEDILEMVDSQIDEIEFERVKEMKIEQEKNEKRKVSINLFRNVKYTKFSQKSFKNRRKRRQFSGVGDKHKLRFSSKRVAMRGVRGLSCRFCKESFKFSRALFYHVKKVHFGSLMKKSDVDDVTEDERNKALMYLYPNSSLKLPDSKKKYELQFTNYFNEILSLLGLCALCASLSVICLGCSST